jgi:hypothetical protein
MGTVHSTLYGLESNISANKTVAEPDGTVAFKGNATVWKDVFFPQGVPKTVGAGNPSLVTWNGNLRGYAYAVGDANDFDPQEFPHDGKEGSTGTFHIHFVLLSATNGDKINWQIEYSQSNINTTFPASTTISAEYTVSGSPTAPYHVIFNIGTFTTLNIASQMFCRITRIAKSAGGTNPASDPLIIGCHYHYELDTAGSREIITK